MSAGDIILLVMALILPPLPVSIKRGVCSGAFFLNLILSVLAYLPGVIHAMYIILKYPEHIHSANCPHAPQRDLERNPVSGTFPGQAYQVPQQDGNMNGVYGSVAPHNHSEERQHLSAGGNQYGATKMVASAPPAYSPSDTKDQSRV